MRRLFLLLFLPCLATAQTVQLDSDQYKPAPTGSFFGVHDTSLLSSFQLQAGLFFHLADKPFLVIDSVTNEITELITRQNMLDLTLAMGIANKAELSLTLPAALSQRGEARDEIDGGPQVSGASFGDAILGVKAKVTGDSKADGVSTAASLDLILPTGDQEQLVGNTSTAAALAGLLQWRGGPLQLAANLGVRIQPKQSFFFESLSTGSSLLYGAALSYAAHSKAIVSAELDGAASLVGGDAAGTSPLEGRVGAKLNAAQGLWIPLGVGVGILDGVGAPRFRLFAGVSFTPTNQDPDKDGLAGNKDKCPNEAESKNQFEDSDGCPDVNPDPDLDGFIGEKDSCPEQKGALAGCPDDDNDNVANNVDKCINEPEDIDGHDDSDGCPDPDGDAKLADKDNDGIPDPDDNCPEQAGTINGCPDADNDGLVDAVDKCINEAEDKDEFEDDDGCPDNDNDKDTIADKDDKCPNDAEDFKGDKEGCPDKKGVITINKTTTIDLSERRIFFDVNSDKLQKRSYETLDLIVKMLNEHPEYKKISVEGHTDDVGNAETNQKLSERRAKRVMEYLISQGIDPARLESKGYGLTRPLINEKNREARYQNRRVEFVIVE
jgi:outer membrane protein OmpA-like peptidoglycan-associated protein